MQLLCGTVVAVRNVPVDGLLGALAFPGTENGTFSMTSFDLAVLFLGLAVGLTFAAHGAQKAFGWWGGPGMAGWQGAMEHMGFRPARLFALVSMGAELVGGLFLAIGFLTPLAAAVLVAQSTVIILQVHLPKGFWTAEGGIEFALQLGIGALVVGLLGRGAVSLDGALGWTFGTAIRADLLVVGLLAGVISFAIPRLGSHNRPAPQAG
jgi:putative oxidoreductase